MPPHEPPKRPPKEGRILRFEPKEVAEVEPGERKLARVETLALVRQEIDRTKRHIDSLYLRFNDQPPINVVIEINRLLDDLPRPAKKILKQDLMALIRHALKYEPRYSVKTYFDFLDDHLEELEKM
jgi:hypothetical protein